MAVFVVMIPEQNTAFTLRISTLYPGLYSLSDRSWMITSDETTVEIAKKLGVSERDQSGLVRSEFGHVMVIQAAGHYWGYGPTSQWEWMKAAFERSS